MLSFYLTYFVSFFRFWDPKVGDNANRKVSFYCLFIAEKGVTTGAVNIYVM